MKRILTTHVGSLPTLDDNAGLAASVDRVVRRQREIGLDLVNEGEYTKGGDWLSYVEARFGGFEPRPAPAGEKPLIAQGRTGKPSRTSIAMPPSAARSSTPRASRSSGFVRSGIAPVR